MASKPGVLTDWPWNKLGSFKYVILAPWVTHSVYKVAVKGELERYRIQFLILPFILWRMLHNQLWITLSRHRAAKGNNRIVDKSVEFEQVDRENNWDDQILLNALLFYIAIMILPGASQLPMWRTDGAVFIALLHAGPVEFLYYWLHRALHHHFLYSRYHSHHHSSIVTQPISSVTHPFAEHLAYFLLFAIPMLTLLFTETGSVVAILGYVTYIDVMNNMGHCNFEHVPTWLFSIFPPLKYFLYTPSYHSLHHTQFRTNYSLFMPIYDYIYGTMDKSSESLYEASVKREEKRPNVVHLTHLTTPESLCHLQIGFASLASNPQRSIWYLWLLRPLTFWSMIITCFYGRTFIAERNSFGTLNLQSWAIPRFNLQYLFQWQRRAINDLIEEAVLEADAGGAKVLSLGLLNQASELNRNGELYIRRYPQLNTKVVDGSSLVVAIVMNSIPKGTTQVLFRGCLSKVAFSIVSALCQRGIQIWIVGEGLSEEEQLKASKGTLFIPFSLLSPKKMRSDCFYHYTPSMLAPKTLENLNSCENWLPRRALSAPRVAGIVHALEGWNVHECGEKMFDVDKVWKATLKHGFRPLPLVNPN